MKNLLVFLPLFLVSGLSEGKDGRFRCRATGAEGREAELRVESGELRAKWEIQFPNSAGQVKGTQVKVTIDGQAMPSIVLREVSGSELEGDYRISRNIPRVSQGMPATIGSLSCRFQAD